MAFNRNIITAQDIQNHQGGVHQPRTLAAAPPAAPATSPPTEDDYLTKLVKYLPPEVVGAYLFVSTLITQNESRGTTARSGWLLALLVTTVVIGCAYDRYVLHVVRWQQILATGVGMIIFIAAIGGWFGTTTWYHPWYGSALLPFFALGVGALRLPPLPAES